MKLSAVGLPSASWAMSSQHAANVVKALTEQSDALVDDLHQTIMGAPKLSDAAWAPPPISLKKTCAANIRSVLAAMAVSTAFDPEPAMQTGADRARQRLAVSSVIEGDRIAFR
jgi:hypothetical protein